MNRIINVLLHFYKRFVVSGDEKILIDSLKKECHFKISDNRENIVILVQMAEDFYFLVKFYIAYKIMVSKYSNVEVHLISLAEPLNKRSKLGFIKNTRLYDRKWSYLYKTLFEGNVITTFDSSKSKFEKTHYESAKLIFSSLKNKTDVLRIRYRGHEIGNLIYDYFLRIENVPTVDINSQVLYEVILNSLRFVDELDRLGDHYKYKYLFTSYLTYTPHGIPAKILFAKGVKVLSFCPMKNFLYKEVLPELFSHVRDFQFYGDLKVKLSNSQIDIGLKNLQDRFKGKLDSSVYYMRESNYSYNGKVEKIENEKKNVIIYLHCFFDSPHIYRSMIFPDFYEWLVFSIEKLNVDNDFNVFLKKHPNGLNGNDKIITDLLQKYQDVKVIDSNVNNINIVENLKPFFILTVYGTIAYEMAYLGVPVFCAGDNPHIDFDFQYTFKNVCEYEKFLTNKDVQDSLISSFNNKSLEVKKQIGQFVYLHTEVKLQNQKVEMSDELNEIMIDLFKTGDLNVFVKKFENVKNILG
ncbi:MAG: hypothetical protein L6Q33_07835 [Bacteriovoracaceae bacterium]|nr:hypothetical protein [Bacteriovoracaceae bacterium]